MEQWAFRRQCESAQTHEKKHVWSCRNRSAQASSALPEQKESGQKEQEEEPSSTTGGSSEETEEHEKQHKLPAYHNWHQQGCVTTIKSSFWRRITFHRLAGEQPAKR